MTYTAETIINLAKQEVGYKEKATNSQLDNKTANAGKGNYTKYARDLYNAGYYNGNKNGYALCDVFVDWLFYKAFGKETGQYIECQNGDLGAGCIYSANYYKNAGRLYSNPKIGDQIFFKDKSGNPCHTGIVVNVTNEKVYTIEGNTSANAVEETSYYKTCSFIYGYGRPRYDEQNLCTVTLPVLVKGNKSGYVKTLQILLNRYNCANLDEDGLFGPATNKAVLAYQKSRKLTIDDHVGPKTGAQLLK